MQHRFERGRKARSGLRSRGGLALLLLLAACDGGQAGSGGPAGPLVVEPGPDAPARIQEALIRARPGDEILLRAGRYECRTPLSCTVDDVRLRGEGMDATILDFSDQLVGGEGVLVTSDGFRIEDLAIEDTPGDGLKFTGCDRVLVRRVRVEWTAGPRTENGGYGIYPVQCSNVLVEQCVTIAASDAGIYSGQSEDVVIRDNELRRNVVGIEVENTRRADVFANHLEGNSAGIMVFDLPSVPRRNGGHARVFDNQVIENNLENFAPEGNVVAMVPSGTGILIMAVDSVEVFDNRIERHGTLSLAINSYRLMGLASEAGTQEEWDEEFEPDAEAISVHDNLFVSGGENPRGSLGLAMASLVGAPLPDIVYDGLVDERELVEGVLPPELGIFIADNRTPQGDPVSFVNLHLGAERGPSTALEPHAGRLPALAAVELVGSFE